MDTKNIQTWFFGALFLVLFIAVLMIFSPFFSVLLWSSLLYVLFSPFYHRLVRVFGLEKKWRGAIRYILAGLFSILSVVVIVVPLIYIAIRMGRQLTSLIRAGLTFLESNPNFLDAEIETVSSLLRELSFGGLDLSGGNLKERIAEALSGGFNVLIRGSTMVARNIGAFFGALAFMIFSLFFFYIDGEYLLRLFTSAFPIRMEYMSQLVKKFKEITQHLFLGYILVAVFQGIIAYIIFLIFRIDGALAFAVLLMFCSFIPMIGAGTVWFPLGVARIVSGDMAGGVLFLALCAFFVSTLDNFLRPLFLKDRIKLHPLIIFFSILGGLAAFGFNGIVLGPMAVIFFLTVLDLFLTEHGIPADR